MRLLPIGLLCLGLALSACDSSDSTLPGVGDYPERELLALAAAPDGTYNTTAFVLSRRVCPPDAFCPDPDGIELAQSVDQNPPPSIFAAADTPDQFEIGGQYRFSIRVQRTQARGPQDDQVLAFTVLGYDRL